MYGEQVTEEYRARHGPRLMVGYPRPRMLNEWIIPDPVRLLSLYNILVRDPIDIRNTIAVYMRYASDVDVWGVREYFPQDYKEILLVLDTGREDCDGHAILVTSILHAVGRRDARLALGYFGTNPDGPQKVGTNHAWCELVDADTPYLVETTGDDVIDELPRVIDVRDHAGIPRYHTLMTATQTKVFLHGHYVEKFKV